ncbi:MAG: hypothetical protein ACHWZW_05925 [Spirulina sp.]
MRYQRNFKRIEFSIFVGIPLGFFLIGSSVYAGGIGDDFSSNSASLSTNDEVFSHSELAYPEEGNQNSERSSTRLTPDWQNWSEPYVDGDSICRESNGDLACLTPTSAEYLRW